MKPIFINRKNIAGIFKLKSRKVFNHTFQQVAHAATACIWLYKDDPEVKEYMQNIDSMRKVTLKVSIYVRDTLESAKER